MWGRIFLGTPGAPSLFIQKRRMIEVSNDETLTRRRQAVGNDNPRIRRMIGFIGVVGASVRPEVPILYQSHFLAVR